MKFVFLDFDGVLNSDAWWSEQPATFGDIGREAAELDTGSREWVQCVARCFDEAAVERLNEIVQAHASQIVITSSWRRRLDVETLADVLSHAGVVAPVHGAIERRLDNEERSEQIADHLRAHPCSGFVILEDALRMHDLESHTVRTHPKEGLLDEHVEMAISILGRRDASWCRSSAPIENTTKWVRADECHPSSAREVLVRCTDPWGNEDAVVFAEHRQASDGRPARWVPHQRFDDHKDVTMWCDIPNSRHVETPSWIVPPYKRGDDLALRYKAIGRALDAQPRGVEARGLRVLDVMFMLGEIRALKTQKEILREEIRRLANTQGGAR